MTKSKAMKLIAELISKYGDVVVAKKYDYWKSKTYVLEGEDTNTILSEIKLSEIDLPSCRSDYEKIERIACGKDELNYIPVEIKESKDIYDSPEQEERRKIAKKESEKAQKRFMRYMSHVFSSCGNQLMYQ